MKKLIAIAVVFALVAGVAFAADLSAAVTGHANLFEGSSQGGGGVKASAAMDAFQIKGTGEVADGKFGALIRIDDNGNWGNSNPSDFNKGNPGFFSGNAWWKPIDQFKLIIGWDKDGIWGKEGVTGWSFNQKAYDGIATGAGNIWGGGYSSVIYRNAFASGLDGPALAMEIKPMDMLGINIAFPMGAKWDKDLFKGMFFQVDLNFAFGDIAITYKGNNVFMYFGGSFGAIALDVGLSVPNLIDMGGFSRLFFGAGLKYSGGAFNVKFRTAVGIPTKSLVPFGVQVGVLPYFSINDNMTIFVNGEMGMDIGGSEEVAGVPVKLSGLTALGWTINPYIRIGAEWGPSFYAGIQIEQKQKGGAVDFALPIGITVGF
jgi:hypothetical protein